jgi:hypothetical protein
LPSVSLGWDACSRLKMPATVRLRMLLGSVLRRFGLEELTRDTGSGENDLTGMLLRSYPPRLAAVGAHPVPGDLEMSTAEAVDSFRHGPLVAYRCPPPVFGSIGLRSARVPVRGSAEHGMCQIGGLRSAAAMSLSEVAGVGKCVAPAGKLFLQVALSKFRFRC